MSLRKMIVSLMTKDYTVLQKEQLLLGAEHGLSMEEIQLYSFSGYNFAQMRTIRTALEEKKDVKEILDPDLSVAEMERILTNKKEKKKSFLRKKALYILPVVVCLCLYLFFGPDDDTVLVLSQSMVNIEVGEYFDATRYVQKMKGPNAVLYLPEHVDTGKPGSYVLVYRLETDTGTVSESLLLNVTD